MTVGPCLGSGRDDARKRSGAVCQIEDILCGLSLFRVSIVFILLATRVAFGRHEIREKKNVENIKSRKYR